MTTHENQTEQAETAVTTHQDFPFTLDPKRAPEIVVQVTQNRSGERKAEA